MGGSGGKTEKFSTIPDNLVPFFERGLGYTEDALKRGQLSRVAGLTPEQQAGFGNILGATAGQTDTAAKSAAARDVLARSAAGFSPVVANTGDTAMLEGAAIRAAQQAWAPQRAAIAAQGLVGGGRQAIARGERDAALSAALADIKYQDFARRQQQALQSAGNVISAGRDVQGQLVAPGQTQAGVGSQIQEQTQREADAPYQGLQRLGGLYSGQPVPGQNVASTGGGK